MYWTTPTSVPKLLSSVCKWITHIQDVHNIAGPFHIIMHAPGGIDPPRQSHATYEASALPPSHHGVS